MTTQHHPRPHRTIIIDRLAEATGESPLTFTVGWRRREGWQERYRECN